MIQGLQGRVAALEQGNGDGVRVIVMGWALPDAPHLLTTTFDGITLTQEVGEAAEAFKTRATTAAMRNHSNGTMVLWISAVEAQL